MPPHHTLAQTYAQRAEQADLSPLATYLLRLVHIKRTNLCVSADLYTTNDLLRLAEEVGDHICVFKTHADTIGDFGERTIRCLDEISRRKKFLVFEDRKFLDIGNTVQQQYAGGPLTIVRWASLINANILPGPAIITALSQAAQKAIAAHNTSVSTDIRASPALAARDDFDDPDDDDDGPHDHQADPDDHQAYSADEYEEDQHDRARKQSVVSVSTTISMKSEAISPQPHHLRPAMPRASSSSGDADDLDDLDDDDDDGGGGGGGVDAQLTQLGPPPYARSLLLLAQMSSAGNFFTPEYTAESVRLAREHRDFVIGFVAQQSLNDAPGDNFITLTPGVQLAAGADALGQRYNTPATLVGDRGTDIIIVGRGITHAPDRLAAAREFRRQGWHAYTDRVRRLRKLAPPAHHPARSRALPTDA